MKVIGSVKEDLALEKRISITPETLKKYISNIQNEVADLELDNIHSEEPKIQSTEPKIKDKNKDNDKI